MDEVKMYVAFLSFFSYDGNKSCLQVLVLKATVIIGRDQSLVIDYKV